MMRSHVFRATLVLASLTTACMEGTVNHLIGEPWPSADEPAAPLAGDAGDPPDAAAPPSPATGEGGGYGENADSSVADAGAPDGAGCVGTCDSFDDRTSLLGGAWTALKASGGGDASAASISSTEYESAPHSAHFHVDAQSSGTGVGATLTLTMPLPKAALSLDLDVKIVGNTGAFPGYVSVVQLALGSQYVGGVSATAGDEALDTFVTFPDGGTSQKVARPGAADAAWHHVHYEVSYDPTSGHVLITWDGSVLRSDAATTTYGQAPVPTSLTLTIGGLANRQVPAMDVYVDNLELR
jgi:hypothetical protein